MAYVVYPPRSLKLWVGLLWLRTLLISGVGLPIAGARTMLKVVYRVRVVWARTCSTEIVAVSVTFDILCFRL